MGAADAQKQILAVCTANICRSPFVAALLQDRFRAAGLGDIVRIESAGVRAQPGREIDPVIAAMLTEMDVEMANKYAMPIVESALRDADMVLVMEETHREALL